MAPLRGECPIICLSVSTRGERGCLDPQGMSPHPAADAATFSPWEKVVSRGLRRPRTLLVPASIIQRLTEPVILTVDRQAAR